ncbi:hypothetical protein [Clostridium sp. DJ247]|uniref:hypothetical protein n=1 Tax=Clostridium sp. DJ247 TaxID=2726188 RepID=UPI0016240F47|nr:hypothetical protein [Clostridium sp. DJ247]MBC2580435.1 hypothetical protein [Clostridium sp. DJ247]
MIEEKQRELEELTDEVDIILSVKDNISQEEIHNFVNKFSLLSEYDIREKIEEITGDHVYTQEFINKVNEDTSNITIGIKDSFKNEHINSETRDDPKSDNYEDHLITEESKEEKDNKNNNYDQDIQKESDKIREAAKIEHSQVHNSNFTEKVLEQAELEHESNESLEQIQNIEVITFDKDNIPEVSFVKAELKYGQLSLEWGWPAGINKILLCYRMDRFPVGSTDSCASQILIKRENGLEIGDYTVNKVIEGNYYFCIYTLVEYQGKILFSEGQRRLVVNKVPEEIFYEVKRKRNLLGKLKVLELTLSTSSKEINLPQLVLIGRIGNMPLQKSDGESLFSTDYQTLTKDKTISFNLPIENIGKNTYVKLFFLDDSNSKVYRIISPAKESLYFK